MKSCAYVAIWYFVVGVLLGAGYSIVLINKRLPEIRYIYVHDIAANRGRPDCPKINSGQILKASDREEIPLRAGDGDVVLQCKYRPRSRINDRGF